MSANGKVTGKIEWVDAARELPDDEMTVLMALSDGEICPGFRDGNDWRYVSADLVDQGDGVTVTHWAALPEHPFQFNDPSSEMARQRGVHLHLKRNRAIL